MAVAHHRREGFDPPGWFDGVHGDRNVRRHRRIRTALSGGMSELGRTRIPGTHANCHLGAQTFLESEVDCPESATGRLTVSSRSCRGISGGRHQVMRYVFSVGGPFAQRQQGSENPPSAAGQSRFWTGDCEQGNTPMDSRELQEHQPGAEAAEARDSGCNPHRKTSFPP